MKRNFKLLCTSVVLLMLVFILSLTGCNNEENSGSGETKYFTVKFDTGGGTRIADMEIKADTFISRPKDPEKNGYLFVGWYEEGGRVEWVFDEYTVIRDMTLEAKWIDAKDAYSYLVNDDGTVTITGVKKEVREMAIPDTIEGKKVVAIGNNAFERLDPEEVFNITVPETVTSIGEFAFVGCEGINITVGGKITEIGTAAFLGCDKLLSVKFGEGLEEIPYQAFAGCVALEEVYLPDSLYLIDENAFEECTGVVKIIFGAGLETVADGAFRFCDSIQVIFYKGDALCYEKLDVATGNDPIEDARVYFYSEQTPEDDLNDYWYFDAKGNPRIYN
ncbi:MAG: leucine-rich repeat protein [Clostridia bacterium]|nr:leucine-rich repeat protein [Clostridia bacterium]